MRRLLSVLASIILITSCEKKTDKNNADCSLNEIILFGGEDAEDFYKTSIESGKIKKIESANYSLNFTYNSSGKLTKREDTDPGYSTLPYKTEYIYNSNGNLVEEKRYDHSNNNQTVDRNVTYQYTNGKLSRIIHDDLSYGYIDITWANDNISSINIHDGLVYSCKYNFTYDLNKANTLNTSYSQYYWQDPSDDYEALREALFFSKNQLTKVTPECAGESIMNITYTYNAKNLIKDILVDGETAWTFKYTCD